MFEYEVDIRENKMFQGTDLQMALLDAERLLEAISNHPEVAMDWDGRPKRVTDAREALNKLIFEIDSARRSFLCGQAEELAVADCEILDKMCENWEKYRTTSGPEQTSFLLLGDPSAPLSALPWWTNLPGGRVVADWADDFGSHIDEAYTEVIFAHISQPPSMRELGRLDIQDNALWVAIREPVEVK